MKYGLMFAGQGAQKPGMGADLFQNSLAARQIFEEADRILGYSLSHVCFEGTIEDLTTCAVCQPAIYTVSVAMLAASREKESFQPVACGGLSLGEFSAACAAGVFEFAEGLRLVAARGRLMDDCCQGTEGGMAAVLGGEPEKIAAVCEEAGIDVANYNCPSQIVISGEKKLLAIAMEKLAPQVMRVVPLTVAGAYHSRLMKPAADRFGDFLEKAELSAPSCLFVQNVVGGAVADLGEIRRNFQKQVCSSVRWEECVRQMMAASEQLVEFGPGNVLRGFMRRIDRNFPVSGGELLS